MEPISLNVLNASDADACTRTPEELARADQIIYDYIASDLPLHALAKRYQLTIDELILWSQSPGTIARIEALRELGARRAEAAAANARATAIFILEELLTTRDGSSDTLRRAATTLLKASTPPRATPTAPQPLSPTPGTPSAPPKTHAPRSRTRTRKRKVVTLASASAILSSVGAPFSHRAGVPVAIPVTQSPDGPSPQAADRNPQVQDPPRRTAPMSDHSSPDHPASHAPGSIPPCHASAATRSLTKCEPPSSQHSSPPHSSPHSPPANRGAATTTTPPATTAALTSASSTAHGGLPTSTAPP